MKKMIAVMIVGVLVELAILASVVYVVVHFIQKFW